MSRLDRQSFLGPDSDAQLFAATLGFVGLGGGGGHAVQQAAHLGIGGYVLVDPDHITESNTNRLVGGTLRDVSLATGKVEIAERQIRGLVELPRITKHKDTWHNATSDLKRCDVIIGGLDSFIEREQLERFARRHLIPYIDIGMDVHDLGGQHLISGQVILSMPGQPCLRCCGLVTDENVAAEATRYGAAGGRPQVVWPNGVLASTAVGLAVQLLTPWFEAPPSFVYLDFDGNRGTVTPNDRMRFLGKKACPHHPANETGDPLFDVRSLGPGSKQTSIAKPCAKIAAANRWQRLMAALLAVARLQRGPNPQAASGLGAK